VKPGIKSGQARAVGEGIALPAAVGENQITGLVIRVPRGFDARDGTADQHITDRDRCGVGRCIAHAAAHVGVERQVERAQQNLTVAGFGNRCFLKVEILGGRRADRP